MDKYDDWTEPMLMMILPAVISVLRRVVIGMLLISIECFCDGICKIGERQD
jgi:hypothetical protein